MGSSGEGLALADGLGGGGVGDGALDGGAHEQGDDLGKDCVTHKHERTGQQKPRSVECLECCFADVRGRKECVGLKGARMSFLCEQVGWCGVSGWCVRVGVGA